MFTYRKGIHKDIPQLTQLALLSYGQFADTLGEHWSTMRTNLDSEQRFTDLVNQATCFVCCNEEKVIGMAFLVPSGNPSHIFQADWCYIRLVGVDPSYSGKGIAKTLTQMCIDHAISTKEKTIALHTSEFMDAARHIYEGIGFTKMKEIDPIFDKRYWLYTRSLSNKT